jgi:hypothetical protein
MFTEIPSNLWSGVMVNLAFDAPREFVIRQQHAAPRRLGAEFSNSIYGRILVDIYKIYSNKWKFHNDSKILNLTRDFLFCKFKLVYESLQNIRDEEDFQMAVDTAVRELNPNNNPCFLKLYFNLREYSEQIRRKSVWTIAGKKYWVVLSYFDHRGILHLDESYEIFLSKLGKRSRRNIRNVRRQAVQSGITHEMEQAPLHPSLERLALGKQAHHSTVSPKEITALDRLIGKRGQGFHSNLRLRSGEIISCCSGFIRDETAFVVYQLNHRGYLQHEPSLTNRAFLIENLIQSGMKNINFVYGCAGILHHACTDDSGTNIWVIRRSFLTLLCGPIIYLAQFSLLDIFGILAGWLRKVVISFRELPSA